MLITTRDTEVARTLAPTSDSIYKLDVLSDKAGLDLLRKLAPTVVEAYPEEMLKLVKDLEGLPLALQVAGRFLYAEKDITNDLRQLIKDLSEGSELLNKQSPLRKVADVTTPTIAMLFQKSVDYLQPEIRKYFASLGAVAPKPATFDTEAMKLIWKVDNPTPIIRVLINRGLLESSTSGRFQMHALLAIYARSLFEE
jgi:hypothetical protein